MAAQRRHRRIEADIEVQARTKKGAPVSTGRIRNVSLGGVFVEMDEPLGFGTELDLSFRLPAGAEDIVCTGFVVWSTKEKPEAMPGMQGVGVRLADIGVSEMRALNDYIEGKLK